MKQYDVPAQITVYATVTVEADTEDEALSKFNSCDWIDSDIGTAEIADFKRTGPIRCEDEP